MFFPETSVVPVASARFDVNNQQWQINFNNKIFVFVSILAPFKLVSVIL